VGCVLSSLLANVIITVWMFHELFVKDAPDRLELKGFHFDISIIRQLGRIGFPAMLSSFMLNLGFYLINTETQKYGPIVLNGQGIANNITAVCFNLPGAFSSAVTTMVSMNVGAGVPDKARRSCVAGCFISAITAVVVIAIVVPLSPLLTILFTRQAEVLEIANRALHIYTYSVVGFGLCMTVQGAFIGLGRTKVLSSSASCASGSCDTSSSSRPSGRSRTTRYSGATSSRIIARPCSRSSSSRA
jgi:Na+-driven multidrug efflux pump